MNSAGQYAMDDLGLSVGTPISLELLAVTPHQRCEVPLIGYRRRHSILVAAPERPGLANAMFPGAECVIRYLQGTNVAGFRTEIVQVCNVPYRYLHLRYPASVDRVTVRRAERVKTHIATKVRRLGDEHPVAAAIMDISQLGVLLLAQKEVGDVGEVVKLEFPVRFSGKSRQLNLSGVVRNTGYRIGREADAGGYYGVEFVDVDQEDQLFLNGFVYELLVGQRGR